MPLVSVIIPCYNAEKYIEKALRSIMDQSFADMEIIVINDCSTDRSGAIIKSLRDTDNRIIYVENLENLRLVKCLNLGLTMSKGKFIARMDSDDISARHRIERQVEFLQNNPSIDIVGTSGYAFDSQEKTRNLHRPEFHDEIVRMMFIDSPLIHPSVMFRKHIVTGVGGYDESFYRVEDYALWVTLAKRATFHNLTEKLINYRIVENSETSLSQENRETRHESLKKVYCLLFEVHQISLTDMEVDQYTYSMFRPNFDKIQPETLLSSYKKVTDNMGPEIEPVLAVRWFAALVIKPKWGSLYTYVTSKYTYLGAWEVVLAKLKCLF